MRLMRSLEFQTSAASPFIATDLDLQEAIGQEAHRAPSVFSFFRPEYRPSGRITSASLVSPESQGKLGVRRTVFVRCDLD